MLKYRIGGEFMRLIETGGKIKKARESKGLSQKQLGDLCGIAQPNIFKYENNQAKPKLDTLKKIASALDIPVKDLLADSVSIQLSHSRFIDWLSNLTHRGDDPEMEALLGSSETEGRILGYLEGLYGYGDDSYYLGNFFDEIIEKKFTVNELGYLEILVSAFATLEEKAQVEMVKHAQWLVERDKPLS